MTPMRILPALLLAAFAGTASAKLPAPDEATKAKAAETTARQAWQAKVDLFQLCKAQDKVAAKYGAKGAKPQATKTAAPAAPAAPAAAAGGTPAPAVTSSAPPPCADPGPFAYNPPEQKPLEAAGAHSPTGTSGSPPSVRPEAAKMAPAAPSAPPTAAAPAKKS